MLKSDLLIAAQDDKPFLVDSIMGELGDGGFVIQAMFHPVVAIGGRDVSLIVVLLDPVGEDRREDLDRGCEDHSLRPRIRRGRLPEDDGAYG